MKFRLRDRIRLAWRAMTTSTWNKDLVTIAHDRLIWPRECRELERAIHDEIEKDHPDANVVYRLLGELEDFYEDVSHPKLTQIRFEIESECIIDMDDY